MPRSPRPRPSPPRWGLSERVLEQPLRTLSGGQRRRVELSRILFSGAQTLLLDEPTNHLDADSITWLRDYLKGYKGGLVVISHDVAMLDTVVNRVFHLDANRSELDVYNVGWKPYLLQRETDERRRRRERLNAEKKASALLGPGRQDAGQGDEGDRGTEHGPPRRATAGRRRGERAHDRVAKLRFPEPGAVRPDPLTADRALPVLRVARGLHRCRPGHRPRLPVVVLGLNGAGKTTLLRILAGVDDPPTPARSSRGTGSSSATTPRSTRTSTSSAPSWRT
jgi:ATPase subunit of ABC transporter with duplicated ATPase domains